METPEITVHARKGLAVIEWLLTTVLAFIAVAGVAGIPQNPIWIPLSILFVGLAVICGLIALSVTRSHLNLRGTILSSSAIRKSIHLDQLASARRGAGYAFTRELILTDKTGTSIRINFAGYPLDQLKPLIKALNPYIAAPSVEKNDYLIEEISQIVDLITNPCPICGYLTLGRRGLFDICPICFWEDDGVYDDPDEVGGGPNEDLSINSGKKNFETIGATQIRLLAYVRPPRDSELRDNLPSSATIRERQEAARLKHQIKKDSNKHFQ